MEDGFRGRRREGDHDEGRLRHGRPGLRDRQLYLHDRCGRQGGAGRQGAIRRGVEEADGRLLEDVPRHRAAGLRLALLAFVLAGALVSAPAAAAPRPGTADDLEARAREYSRGRYALFFARQAVGFATLALLLATGLSARLRDAAESVASRPWAVVAVYWVLFLLVTSLLAFPLQLYGGFLRERRFDFARQSLAGWMGDWAKGLLVGA